MKNYYEILEVDKKASSDVIEKAYRTLVKKYHPDLKSDGQQEKYEEKMKDINEAYSVLSNDFKRASFDEQLESATVSKSEYEKLLHENMKLKNEIESISNRIHNNNTNITREPNHNYSNVKEVQSGNTISNMGRIMQENIRQATRQAYNNAYNQAYNDAYREDMRNRGYRIKYKHDFKYYIKLVAYTIFMILLCALIYQIPIVKNFFTKLYEENIIFQSIVDIFRKTFTTRIW